VIMYNSSSSSKHHHGPHEACNPRSQATALDVTCCRVLQPTIQASAVATPVASFAGSDCAATELQWLPYRPYPCTPRPPLARRCAAAAVAKCSRVRNCAAAARLSTVPGYVSYASELTRGLGIAHYSIIDATQGMLLVCIDHDDSNTWCTAGRGELVPSFFRRTQLESAHHLLRSKRDVQRKASSTAWRIRASSATPACSAAGVMSIFPV
jgi:hypothetical protein